MASSPIRLDLYLREEVAAEPKEYGGDYRNDGKIESESEAADSGE
jgi:hypothetical protein